MDLLNATGVTRVNIVSMEEEVTASDVLVEKSRLVIDD